VLQTVHTLAPKAFLTEPQMPPAQAAALMALLNGSVSNNGVKR